VKKEGSVRKSTGPGQSAKEASMAVFEGPAMPSEELLAAPSVAILHSI
jgi:hypothetical protein